MNGKFSTFRTTPRTPKLKDYSEETLPISQPSNFITHVDKRCAKRPEAQSFESWQERQRTGTDENMVCRQSSIVILAWYLYIYHV